MPKMAATMPMKPAVEETRTVPAPELELPPPPLLVPGDNVPVPDGCDCFPAQVYFPRMSLFGPARGWKWLHVLSMFSSDCRLKAPLTRLSDGSVTLV